MCRAHFTQKTSTTRSDIFILFSSTMKSIFKIWIKKYNFFKLKYLKKTRLLAIVSGFQDSKNIPDYPL